MLYVHSFILILFYYRFLVALSLLGFASHALAAYSTNTDALYSALDECSSDVGSDIACIETVKEGLETMSGYIQDVSTMLFISCFITIARKSYKAMAA